MIASLSVYDLLISLDLRPQIKWPNDVLVNGKKIAGTIAESRIISQKFSYAVIGIGVNVNLLVDESSPIINTYTSIYKEKKVEYDRYELLKILLLNLDDYYSYILSGKNIIPKWKDKIMNIGKNIKISFDEYQPWYHSFKKTNTHLNSEIKVRWAFLRKVYISVE